MRTVQRQEYLVVDATEPLQRKLLAAHRQLPIEQPELAAFPRDGPTYLGTVPHDRLGRLLLLQRADQRRPTVDNTGLRHRDVVQRVAEPLGVFQADRGNHTYPGM